MGKYNKGKKTKKSIVNRINTLFNHKEMLLTWDEIALELNISRSRITNYFPKKELLILAIYEQFEEKLTNTLREKQAQTTPISISYLKDYYESIMDLLFEFRFSISYVLVNPMNDLALKNHIDSTYKNNKIRLQDRIDKLVEADLIDNKLKLSRHFEPFAFQHTNLLTTWVISYRLYDKSQSYKKVKPIYLQGILNCYLPYLTERGISDFKKL